MKKIVVLFIVVGGLFVAAFYMGWISINRDKVDQDIATAKEKTDEMGKKSKESLDKAVEKGKEGLGKAVELGKEGIEKSKEAVQEVTKRTNGGSTTEKPKDKPE